MRAAKHRRLHLSEGGRSPLCRAPCGCFDLVANRDWRKEPCTTESFHREGLVLPPSPTSYHLEVSLLLSCCLSSRKSPLGGKSRLAVIVGRGMGGTQANHNGLCLL